MYFAVSEVVVNRYRIDNVLGQSESGIELYSALDIPKATPVAIIRNPRVATDNIFGGFFQPDLSAVIDTFVLADQDQIYVMPYSKDEDPQVIWKRLGQSERKIQRPIPSNDVASGLLASTSVEAHKRVGRVID